MAGWKFVAIGDLPDDLLSFANDFLQNAVRAAGRDVRTEAGMPHPAPRLAPQALAACANCRVERDDVRRDGLRHFHRQEDCHGG